ncbi:preprotein translocase subunit SecG [Marinoscillum luteum]|uniref:Protein-export membrane protein SecG n=1 Tax=Marinoscillum luteum TaxID=861051 RepID=A0ABW7N3F2_9BACT
MYALIISIIILVAFLLILVVLAQNPKGGGLSSQFGGAGTQQIMGVKKTGDILEKLTWGLAIAMLVLTLTTNFFVEDDTQTLTSPNIESAQESVLPTQSIQSTEQPSGDLGLEEDSVN